MSMDQPQPIQVVCIPDAEQVACLRFLSNQLDLIVISIAKHELKRVHMPFKQSPNGKLPEPIERRISLRGSPDNPAPPHSMGKTAIRRPEVV